MFETAQERVKLLKTGLSEKEIEMLYIEHNNFKIIRTPILYDPNEFDITPSVFDNEGYLNNSQMTEHLAKLLFPLPPGDLSGGHGVSLVLFVSWIISFVTKHGNVEILGRSI